MPGLIDVFLQPGEYFVGDAGFRIRTLLGSCVSITLWHPQRRIGAMSHFLLAQRGKRPPGPLDGRYGADSLALMLEELAQQGVAAAECQAKIFGGSAMFAPQTCRQASEIGRHNGEAARALLRTHGIAVAAESLFGAGHRQILFHIASGDVWERQAAALPARR
ncbi:chemotaxis protein CheD [Pseudoduganella sp. LjRoot289]|uniref:chemotaxis protein CheD n=1 Tax=Pseudoduganella sp. LjRoot289 TaxID=3342314 RepID=UPI003ED00E2E